MRHAAQQILDGYTQFFTHFARNQFCMIHPALAEM
jgi:hypothetical protein